jgi:hypothetical protein
MFGVFILDGLSSLDIGLNGSAKWKFSVAFGIAPIEDYIRPETMMPQTGGDLPAKSFYPRHQPGKKQLSAD